MTLGYPCNCIEPNSKSEISWRKAMVTLLYELVALMKPPPYAYDTMRGGLVIPVYLKSQHVIPLDPVSDTSYTDLIAVPDGTTSIIIELLNGVHEVDISLDGINQWDYLDYNNYVLTIQFLSGGMNPSGVHVWAQRIAPLDSGSSLRITFVGR